ncbi:MAG: hypothetical protein AAB268_01965 [Elusimicrobiota bacterium]
MNTKMMTFVSTLTLILAASASAQMISILPSGRGSLPIGVPTIGPGLMGQIVISPRNLPPPLTPSIALAFAPPVPVGIAMPILAVAATPRNRILAASAQGGEDKDAAPINIENFFDGRKQPAGRGGNVVRQVRYQTLPEDDLAKEIGLY